MTTVKEVGKSGSGKTKVEVEDIGKLSGVRSVSKAGNKMIVLNADIMVEDKPHKLTGFLTQLPQ